MEAIIEVNELHKRFGPAVALDGMTFTAGPGQVTGFVGPNGAGKSTTRREILGPDRPDSGTALVGGAAYRDWKNPLTRLGAMIAPGALQPGRSGRNHLLWLAHSRGVGARRGDEGLEGTRGRPGGRTRGGAGPRAAGGAPPGGAWGRAWGPGGRSPAPRRC